jgi:uncharacterized protein (DUF1778 family)
MATDASTRLELRIQSESKRRIEHAANLVHESTSDFVRGAAERRADEVLLEHSAVTIVPAEYFDRMIAALEESPRADPALSRAAAKARRSVRR